MSVTINASTSSGLVLGPDNSGSIQLQNNGTTKLTVDSTGAYGQLVQGTALSYTQATNAGTTLDFTGIPSWVKRITVMFSGVSVSGTSSILIQIGDSGGIETTSYTSWSAIVNSNSAVSTTGSTAGFIISTINAAADILHGGVQLTQVTGNNWVEFGSVGRDGTVDGVTMSGGSKTLSDTLTQVRITTVDGNAFDAGSVNILYEG